MAARRGARDAFPASLAGTASSSTPTREELDGIVIYRWEAPLFFANAGAFRRQIRHLVRERRPRWVVLQCEAITDIDVTAAEMLEQLDDELNQKGVHMAFAEMRTRLQDLTLPVRAVRDARPRPLLPDREGARSTRSEAEEG